MLRPWLVVVMRAGARGLGIRWRRGAPLVVALALEFGMELGSGIAFPGTKENFSPNSARWIYALACGGGLMARTAPAMAVGSWVLAALFQAWTEGTLALGTPLISLVTLPLFCGVLYPLGLSACWLRELGASETAEYLVSGAGWISSAALNAISRLALGQGWLWIVSPTGLALGGAMAALTLNLRRGSKAKWVALVLAIRIGGSLMSDAAPRDQAARAAQVQQLDIGQGDAAWVHEEDRVDGRARDGMIDSGSEHALGDPAWIRLWAQRGVTRLNWIALTHLDEDHAGGVLRLARLMRIDCVATSRAQLESARGRALVQGLSGLGIRVVDWNQGDCVPFPTLGPRSRARKANSNMGAVFIPLRGGGFYFSAGDADREDEARFGAWARGQALHLANGPRVLKLSHHGSRTSSSPEFIQAIAPTQAWISCGVGNRYGHPNSEVLESLPARLPVHRTDREGSLTATSAPTAETQ
jgi:competence protein ComEC